MVEPISPSRREGRVQSSLSNKANVQKSNSDALIPADVSGIEEMKKGESNILVALRLRPLLPREIMEG